MSHQHHHLQWANILSIGLINVVLTSFPTLSQPLDSTNFEQQVEPLITRQFRLINRLETAIATEDFTRLDPLQARLFLHLGTVDRFLETQYRIPELLCGNNSPTSPNLNRLTPEQQQVYCSLYDSAQHLESFMPILEYRVASVAGRSQTESVALLDPASSTLPDASALNLEPRLIGQPTKQPVVRVENESASSVPIIPLPQAVTLLQQARQSLVNVSDGIPLATALFAPSQATLNTPPPETERYSTLLREPNTGITTLSSSEAKGFPPLFSAPRELTRVQTLFPSSQDEYVPQLIVELTERSFKIGNHPLAYGFMTNVGDIDLNELSPQLQNLDRLSDLEKEFFLFYTPPQTLQEIQVDRRRFRFGKTGLGDNPTLSALVFSEVVAQTNQTYVLRLIQYQLPEVILNNEPISRSRRVAINSILETPSSDLLIAFRPVRRQLDGSYILLWRVLRKFQNPQITDLEDYLELE